MFRKFTLPAAALLLALSLTACTSPQTGDESQSQEDQTTTAPVTSQKPSEENKPTKVTVEKTVIYDSNDCKVTINSLDYDGLLGPELKVTLENNSNRDITVQVQNFSVNDLMVETYFSATVAAGKKSNDAITIAENDLERSEITQMKNLEFILHFSDPQTYSTLFDSDIIKLTTSADPSYTQAYNDKGTLALEDDNIRIVIREKTQASDLNQTEVVVFLENKSKKDLTVQSENVSVNGFMIDPIFSSSIAAGKKRCDVITFLKDDLEENGIEKMEMLEIAFRIIDWDRYGQSYTSDKVSVKFK